MTGSSRPWASVVIPIKDERDNLPTLTEQLLKVLGSHERSRATPFEILYVDDGSTDGSSQLVHAMLAHDLVDEMHLLVYPLVLGGGKRLFPAGKRLNLKLVESKALPTGVVFQRYRRAE